jgi:hypothetical protein
MVTWGKFIFPRGNFYFARGKIILAFGKIYLTCGNVSIVSGIGLKSVNAGCSLCVFKQQMATFWRFDEAGGWRF